jgi:hypothetical protein
MPGPDRASLSINKDSSPTELSFFSTLSFSCQSMLTPSGIVCLARISYVLFADFKNREEHMNPHK